MPADPDARLLKVLDLLAAAADGPETAALLACPHVHAGGEFGLCALHPGAGLLCRSCADLHDARAHRDRVCDLCQAAPAVDLCGTAIDCKVPLPTRRMGGVPGVLGARAAAPVRPPRPVRRLRPAVRRRADHRLARLSRF